MVRLPENIKNYFYKVLDGDVSIEHFEKWVYEQSDLEEILGSEIYLLFISLNYRQRGAKYDQIKLIEQQVDLGDYQTYKLLTLLKRAKERKEDLPDILVQFYKLYCQGYYFLQNIGVNYGLEIELEGLEFWSSEMKAKHESQLQSFFPELDHQFKLVIGWLETGKLILTGTKNELNRFQYNDFRSNEEKDLSK